MQLRLFLGMCAHAVKSSTLLGALEESEIEKCIGSNVSMEGLDTPFGCLGHGDIDQQ